jgi:hypothetical protein
MSRRAPKGPQPSRQKSDLADVVEMLLDKGIVINADIAVTVGDTEFLGVKIRAAIASFETAAKYGLEFPSGTDRRRVEEQTGVPAVTTEGPIDEEQARLSELVFDDGGADVNVGPAPPLSVQEEDESERDAEEEEDEDDESEEAASMPEPEVEGAEPDDGE